LLIEANSCFPPPEFFNSEGGKAAYEDNYKPLSRIIVGEEADRDRGQNFLLTPALHTGGRKKRTNENILLNKWPQKA